MNTNATPNLASESTQSQTEQNDNTSQQLQVEKGSGYGPPNEGSGETVEKNDLSPDGQPIPKARTSKQSEEAYQ